MRKGQLVNYTSGMGGRYSARLLRVHRNGEVTLRVYFPLNADDSERVGCFQGDRFRVSPNQVEERRK